MPKENSVQNAAQSASKPSRAEETMDQEMVEKINPEHPISKYFAINDQILKQEGDKFTILRNGRIIDGQL